MNRTFRSWVLTTSVLTLSGCATIPQYDPATMRAQLAQVRRDDGVSREEALIIAQNALLDIGADYDWNVMKPRVAPITTPITGWEVVFPPLEDGWGSGRRPSREVTLDLMLPIFVRVDGTTGEAQVIRPRVTITPR